MEWNANLLPFDDFDVSFLCTFPPSLNYVQFSLVYL